MLKNLTQHTEIIDGKEFHFVADYDSNFNQVKTALNKTMTYFDGLEEQQKKLQEQMKAVPPTPVENTEQESLNGQPVEV